MLISLALVAVFSGCGGPAEPQASTRDSAQNAAQPPNVVFILIDTLRADHMSLYGYERPTTPFLEELAEQSLVFTRARAQAGCTFPSVNSLLTSRYPFAFYSSSGTMAIPEHLPVLPELLRTAGYSTAAVSSSPIVRKTPSDQNPDAGFDRGFDVFDEACLWDDAECVNTRTLRALDRLTPPFFAYLHYMDPHDPYRPPTNWQQTFTQPYDAHTFIADGDPNPIARMLYDNGPQLDLTDRDMQHLIDLYDEEIRFTDARLRDLLAELARTGKLDNTIVVITADHGEEFLEHDHIKHCRGVWDTLTRVPLIIHGPGIQTAVIDQPVQLVDLRSERAHV